MRLVDPDQIAQRIATAGPVSAVSECSDLWRSPAARASIDLYLDGGLEHRVAALGVLLDGYQAASQSEETDADASRIPAARLAEAWEDEGGLLRPIGDAWGLGKADTLRRLAAMRASSIQDEPLVRPPELDAPARTLAPVYEDVDAVWQLDLGDTLSIVEGGLPGPGGSVIETWGIRTRPGLWTVRVAVAAERDDDEDEGAEARLILTHEDHVPAETDIVTEEAGRWSGRITVVNGDLSPRQLISVKHASEGALQLWPWGVGMFRPRCPGAILAGGREGRRTVLVLEVPYW